MPTPYSTRFVLEFVPSSGDAAAYTVPDGYTAIVQHIDAAPAADQPDQIAFAVAAMSATVTAIQIAALSGAFSVPWDGKLVLNAGEVLQIFPSSTNWNVQVSGALLADS